jgi:uncharacterized protein (DUF779 family)
VGLEFTAAARTLLAELRQANPTAILVIVIGGGCCENTAPILMKNFRVGRTDRLLGEAEGVKVYASENVRHLESASSVLDVVEYTGVGGFSLEVSRGARLVLRSGGRVA